MYSTGQSKARIHNEREVTVDFIVNEANEIWKKCKEAFTARSIKCGDEEKTEELLTELRRAHKDFSTSYPITLRYMAQMHSYSAKAFTKFLRYIEKNPWKNEAEYLDAQANYVCLLYKELHSKWNKTDVSRLRTNIRAILQKEHDDFKLYHDEFKAEVENDEKRYKKEYADEFIEFMRKAGATLVIEEPANDVVSVQADESVELYQGDLDDVLAFRP